VLIDQDGISIKVDYHEGDQGKVGGTTEGLETLNCALINISRDKALPTSPLKRYLTFSGPRSALVSMSPDFKVLFVHAAQFPGIKNFPAASRTLSIFLGG
jgi:hypothetical protein